MGLLTPGEISARQRRAENRLASKPLVRPPTKPILRVAVDIDNTMIKNDTVWRDFMRIRRVGGFCTHPVPSSNEVQTHWDYWQKFCPRCWNECLLNPYVLRSHKLRPGVLSTLTKMTRARVLFTAVTARDAETQEATLQWFRQYGLCPPRIFSDIIFSKGDKLKDLKALKTDLVIDDHPGVVYAAQRAGIDTILMDAPHNQIDLHWPGGINAPFRARSWKDVEHYLATKIAVEQALPDFGAIDLALL